MLKSVVCNQLMYLIIFFSGGGNIACHVLSTRKEFYCTLVILLLIFTVSLFNSYNIIVIISERKMSIKGKLTICIVVLG